MNRSEVVKKAWITRLQRHVYKVDIKQFEEVTTPEVAYLLGLLWADGWIHTAPKYSSVALECLADDMKDFYPIFQTTGLWKQYFRHRANRRPQCCVKICHKPLVQLLLGLGYGTKSSASHATVLNHIPATLHQYWLRGFFDGDGCYSCGDISFSGPYEQDWSALHSILADLGVFSSSYRRIDKRTGNKQSTLRIRRKADISRFMKYCFGDVSFKSLQRKQKIAEPFLASL